MSSAFTSWLGGAFDLVLDITPNSRDTSPLKIDVTLEFKPQLCRGDDMETLFPVINSTVFHHSSSTNTLTDQI